MAEWFRNREWNDEIATVYDAKLGRARDKGQYLTIQAYTLMATRPDITANLCRRAIALDDPLAKVNGGLYLGTALALLGDVDGAIDALEGAIEAQRQHPGVGSGAYVDQALLVALGSREDLYQRALDRLSLEQSWPVEQLDLASLIALALIRHDSGGDGSEWARAALAMLDGVNRDDAGLPTFLDLATIQGRLRACL